MRYWTLYRIDLDELKAYRIKSISSDNSEDATKEVDKFRKFAAKHRLDTYAFVCKEDKQELVIPVFTD